jgi:hypothetical protein
MPHVSEASVLTHSIFLVPDLFDLKVSGEYYYEECYDDYYYDDYCYTNSNWFEIDHYYTPQAPDVKIHKNDVPENYVGPRHQTVYFAKNWTSQDTTIYVNACRNWNYAASPIAFKLYMFDGDKNLMPPYESGAIQNSQDCASFTLGPVQFTSV